MKKLFLLLVFLAVTIFAQARWEIILVPFNNEGACPVFTALLFEDGVLTGTGLYSPNCNVDVWITGPNVGNEAPPEWSDTNLPLKVQIIVQKMYLRRINTYSID